MCYLLKDSSLASLQGTIFGSPVRMNLGTGWLLLGFDFGTSPDGCLQISRELSGKTKICVVHSQLNRLGLILSSFYAVQKKGEIGEDQIEVIDLIKCSTVEVSS